MIKLTTKKNLALTWRLSGVLACIFLEFLESQLFKDIIPNDIHYFKDIDDILIIYPKEHNIPSIACKLNQVEQSIYFIQELEKNNSLPFGLVCFLCLMAYQPL